MSLLLLLACHSPKPDESDTRPDHSGHSGGDDSPGDSPGDSPVDTTTTTPHETWNVVVILADDERADGLWAMPEVSARLVPQVVAFDRAYVTIPMCCPMRSSFLSGGWYPKDTGVRTNGAPNGGVTAFLDTDTLATRLQGAGVATGIFGKYLNDYELEMAPYVPPGWDQFVVTGVGDGAYNQTVIVGNSGPNAATTGTVTDTGGVHLTTYLFDQALQFVDAHAEQPFFVLLAPNSPHVSGNPAKEDRKLYADYSPRPASWNEADVSDKPAWIQATAPLDDTQAAAEDATARLMMQNLASLDRETAAFADALATRGVLDHTLFVYTSDNGYLFGEHRVTEKGLAYEPSVRVPLLVRAPGVTPRDDHRLVAVNLDLAATVAENFGLPATGEGIPLTTALSDTRVPTRDHVFLDNYTTGFPIWSALVTERFKYVEWATGETELYDLDADPDEMQSLHASPPDGADVTAWHTLIDEDRGLAILTEELPDAQVGVPYDVNLQSWGGTAPVIYSLDGALPDGLMMGGGGHIQGTPTTAGTTLFGVVARDASVSGFSGLAQRFDRALSLTVTEGAAAAPRPDAVVAHRVSATVATVTVQAADGTRVSVRATADRSGEGRRIEAAGVATHGVATLTLDGLTANRPWTWVVRMDGRIYAQGPVPVR